MEKQLRAEQTERAAQTIVFLAFPGSQILDITGPYQVFVRAAEIFLRSHPNRKAPYKVLLASATRSKNIPTNCGLSLTASVVLRSLRRPIHTLLVVGG